MSESSKQRSVDFLKISSQFKLGALVTEASHPVTAHLSDVANKDIPAALNLLFQTDEDVLKKYVMDTTQRSNSTVHLDDKTFMEFVKNGGFRTKYKLKKY